MSRSQYFEVIDIILNKLDSRLDLAVLKEIENLLINSTNMNIALPSTELKELYKDDINFSSLETQLYTIYQVIFEAEIFAGEAKVKFRRIKFSKIANFEELLAYACSNSSRKWHLRSAL